MVATNYDWDPEFDSIASEFGDAGVEGASYTQCPSAFGRVVSQSRAGVSRHYHSDAIGTTRALSDNNQNVIDTTVYNAFGEQVDSTGVTVNPFGYVGALGYHASSMNESIYVRSREYLARIARWASKDQFPSDLEDHAYTYADNSPSNKVDPSGNAIAPILVIGVVGGSILLACTRLQVEIAFQYYPGSSDKFKHCWVSCRMSRFCGTPLAEVVGVIKEAGDIFADSGWDWQDLWANQQCIALSLSGCSPTSILDWAIRGSCEECCRRRVGYNRARR